MGPPGSWLWGPGRLCSALPASLWEKGGCSAPGNCREECGARGRKHLISLLPLIGAENKPGIQLERKEHESRGRGALRQPPSPASCRSTSPCPCQGDLPFPWAGHCPTPPTDCKAPQAGPPGSQSPRCQILILNEAFFTSFPRAQTFQGSMISKVDIPSFPNFTS